MREDYEELLKLSGDNFWNAIKTKSQTRIDNYIKNHRDGKALSLEDQKTEYESLKEHYEKVRTSPAFKSGIDAITDVYDWFNLKIDEFSEEANYYLIRNMIYLKAELSRYEALEYGDEWLANQYGGVGDYMY